MKRPFALIGFTYLFTLTAACFLEINAAITGLIMSLVLFIFTLCIPKLRKDKTIPIFFLTCAIALTSFCGFTYIKYQPVTALDGMQCKVDAVITQVPGGPTYDRYYYIIETDSITLNGKNPKIKLRLSSQYELNCEPYDRISANLQLFLPSDGEGYNSRIHYRSKGIYLYSYALDDITVTPAAKRPLLYWAQKTRIALSESVDKQLASTEGAVVKGVLLGDDSQLPNKNVMDIRKSGLSHLLAVSGLHVSIISMCLFALLKFLRINKRLSSIICMVVVICFMAITGFSPSITRAAIMSIVYFISLAIYRQADSLNSLGLSVLIITLINPFAAADIGLLLSFSATLGILLIQQKINNILMKPFININRGINIIKSICSTVACTLAATIFTTPITMMFFGSVTLIGPIANVLCIFPSSVLLITGALAAIIGAIPMIAIIAPPFAFVSGWLAKYILWVSDILADFPIASLSTSYAYVMLWLGGSIILITFAVLIKRRYAIRFAALLSCIVLFGGVLSHQLLYQNVTEVISVNQDSGSSTIITNNNRAVVIGCGGAFNADNRVAQILNRRGISTIDMLILPSLEENYASHADSLISEFDPISIVCPKDGDYYDEIKYSLTNDTQVYTLSDSNISLWDKIDLDIRLSGDDAVIMINYGDTCILCSTPNADMNIIPVNYRNPQAVIYDSEAPANFQMITTDLAIVSGEYKQSSPTLVRLKQSTEHGFLTSDYDCLVLQTRGNRDIIVRNEI